MYWKCADFLTISIFFDVWEKRLRSIILGTFTLQNLDE